MKRKLCFVLALLCLLPCVLLLPALGAQDAAWGVLTYTYDPDTEGQIPQSGKLSVLGNGEQNYLHRPSTITWDAENALLFVDGEQHEGGSAYLSQAGRYELSVTNKDTGESFSYAVEILPVVKALLSTGEDVVEEYYFEFDKETKKFAPATFMQYPVIVCTNASAKITVDDGVKDAEMVVYSGDEITRLGSHTLRFTSNAMAWNAPYCVSACTAQTVFDEALGKNCLELKVGNFPGELSVLLDDELLLPPGSVHRISRMGQHTLSATLDGRVIDESGALPGQNGLCLQMALLLPSDEIKQPFVLDFSRWDACFYVDGERIEGDYRIESAGEHVFVAKDEHGNTIKNAFLVKRDYREAGTPYTELAISFNNHHHLYAFLMLIPVLALIGVAVYFFLQRRRIV